MPCDGYVEQKGQPQVAEQAGPIPENKAEHLDPQLLGELSHLRGIWFQPSVFKSRHLAIMWDPFRTH